MYEKLKIYNNLYSTKERKTLITKSLEMLRNNAGLQQKEVAELIGIKYQTYCNYESGRSEPPAEILVRLSKLYEVPIDVIVQADNMDKDTNVYQAQVDLYKEQIAELREKLETADPHTRIALKAMINQIEKLVEAIDKAL